MNICIVLYSPVLIQKMWLEGGGQTEYFQNVGGGGGKGVYAVLTLQKSRGARAHLGGGGKGPLNAALFTVAPISNEHHHIESAQEPNRVKVDVGLVASQREEHKVLYSKECF